MSQPISTLYEPITDPEILEDIERLPTEDELPCDDGEPMETWRHVRQMNVLTESLELHWADRSRFFVGGNMFLHFDPQDRRRFRGPDFFLVLDVEDRERKSWVVWQEGMRFPDLIVELLSDTTRETDKVEKKALYERVFRTSEYYLYDPYSQEFLGYHLRGVCYEAATPDTQGRLYSPVTGLCLGVCGDWLRWITPQGEPLPTPREQAEREIRRAEQEKQRAEQEKQRAEQEKQHAEQEKQRAEEAEQRAGQAEQRAARLAARLRELGIEPDD